MAMPVAERLVNLTIALLETRRPLTFDEIRRRTRYYPQADASSARRMFERDKETLRSLGVPIETRQEFGMDDPGYIIERKRYELRDIDLTPEEVAALALAVDLVGPAHGALPLAKVAARAPDPIPITGPPARIGLDIDVVVAPIATAVVERRVVRFSYRTADGREGMRTVEPYGIVRRRRAWYLVGRDRDRGDLRGFRLGRMLGHLEVMDESAAFDVPVDLDLAAVISGPAVEPVAVELLAGPAGRWAIEARGGRVVALADRAQTSELDLLRIEDLDPLRDRAWLLGVSPDAAVIRPADLRGGIVAALERVVTAHEGEVSA
jgi:proteasome accessory factor B